MAERRMFAKTIIDSDAFLDMPQSTQLLYFHLSMRADDEGFINNAKSIMRNTGCKEDDLKILIAKRFIIPFESGVIVIKHWRMHNYIQSDRITPTKYLEEKEKLVLATNKAYTEKKDIMEDSEDFISLDNYTSEKNKNSKQLSPARIKRLEAKKQSSLPYSFEYKIRNAFVGEMCPICNCRMNHENNLVKPTIQHNVPISLGGEHEIGNISVICLSCNSSIINREITGPLNNDLVRLKWEYIGNVSGMDTQIRLDKNRLDLGKNSIIDISPSKSATTTKFIKPTIEEIALYCKERNNSVDADKFYNYYESKGWVVGKVKMKNWKACVHTWEKSGYNNSSKKQDNKLPEDMFKHCTY